MNVVHVSPPRAAYGRSARKREARADAILDEAMRVLAADGPDALTLARIGKALGLVPAALYRYFDSKDALLAALQRRAIAEIRTVLEEELARVDGEPVLVRSGRRLACTFHPELTDDLRVHAALLALAEGDPRG